MKIVFISNFFSPHQREICDRLCELTEEFIFIETVSTKAEEIPIGWRADGKPSYVIGYDTFTEENEFYLRKIEETDVVIFGSCPYSLIKSRLKKGGLTFKYCERVYKKKRPFYEIPLRAVKYFYEYGRYRNLYLLCASAFTAGDYAKTGTFINRAYKWGYFPPTKMYDIEDLLQKKENNSILWAGRFIDWKHPEIPVKIAKMLKSDGYDFVLNMLGTGEMEEEIKALIKKEDLCDCVHLLGSVTPEEVREYMEKAKLQLITSDRQEGWGATLNEAMNSACVTVANSQIGSAPYLIEDGVNGLLYKDKDIASISSKVKLLLDNHELCTRVGRAAYQTVTELWNGNDAAKKLIELSQKLISEQKSVDLYESGPCSRAEIIKDNWYSNTEKR